MDTIKLETKSVSQLVDLMNLLHISNGLAVFTVFCDVKNAINYKEKLFQLIAGVAPCLEFQIETSIKLGLHESIKAKFHI